MYNVDDNFVRFTPALKLWHVKLSTTCDTFCSSTGSWFVYDLVETVYVIWGPNLPDDFACTLYSMNMSDGTEFYSKKFNYYSSVGTS